MPTLRELLCKSEIQRAFLLKGAAALHHLDGTAITPALVGDVRTFPTRTLNAALKPADVVREELPAAEAAWGRVAGYFQVLAHTETSPAVLTFAVLALLVLFPAFVAEVRSCTPVNYAAFFDGNAVFADLTTRFETHLTGTQARPAKLPVEILVAELQLFRRLTPPLMQ